MAVMINFDGHAYCKVRYDQWTLDNLEQNLFRIESTLSRGIFWRHLWVLTMDYQLSSMQYFNFLCK